MQVEIKIDETISETKVIILAKQADETVNELVRRISGEHPQVIAGFSGDTVKILEQEHILRVYTSGGKVYAVTEQGEYTLRLRLYEAEERLDKTRFVRISNSEIVNLRKVKGFDLSYTGTIRVNLWDGTASFVSRRYVSRIKAVLGL